MKSTVKKILTPALVIIAAVLIAALMFAAKPEPKATEAKPEEAPLVTSQLIQKQPLDLNTSAQGTVKPSTQIQLSAQVAGQIMKKSPSFVAGGEFKKGDVLLEIDDADYVLAVKQASAQVKQARYQLTVVQAGQKVAKSDMEAFQSSALAGDETPNKALENPLALYEPQVENAEAAVESAKATLEKARLNLQRTKLKAPFSGRVRSKMVDVGQFVNPGAPLGELYATKPLSIQVSLPLAELQWIINKQAQGNSQDNVIPAQVIANIDGTVNTWKGQVTRTLGELDEVGRQAQFVVEVSNTKSDKSTELRVGMYVDIKVSGGSSEPSISIPQKALSRDQSVWVITENSTLESRAVSVGRANREYVIVNSGLNEGERIVISALPEALPGMKVRTVSSQTEEPKP